MGLLTEGSPLSWEETKAKADHVRQHGVTQFINLYRRLRDRQGDVLKWGDEVSRAQFSLFWILQVITSLMLCIWNDFPARSECNFCTIKTGC